MQITSPAFDTREVIPTEYTCDGDNINPPLVFSDVPSDAKSLALIMDDPDAPSGMFVHWILWNIPPQTTGIAENGQLPTFGTGTNGSGKLGYIGPCPPDKTHRYFFKLYALKDQLNLKNGATKDELLAAMQNSIIAEAELMGLYTR